MVKSRMTSVDAAAEVACIKQRFLGMRLANVYDLSAKVYVLKLARSGEAGEKALLLLESGSRFHTTAGMRDKPDVPSNFTLKLRKHLRTRRLEDVRQLGVDRIVDFVFGSGEATYHLILEMYSQGNIILTDKNYEVLTLLRSHRDDEKGFAIMARHPYPMHAVRLRSTLQKQGLADGLAAAAAAAEAKKGEGSGVITLKAALADLMPYGPAIAEHIILGAQLLPSAPLALLTDPSTTSPNSISCVLPEDQLSALHASVARLEAWFSGLEAGVVPEGFISVTQAVPANRAGKKAAKGKGASAPVQEVAPLQAVAADGSSAPISVFQDYYPLSLVQVENAPGVTMLPFPSFDAAMEEFYSKIEGQRADVQQADAEANAMGKLDRLKADQAARANALEKEGADDDSRAALIEYNLAPVDAAIDAVNEALARGMDWHDLERMIKEERKAGNPVAELIHSLQLEANKATLMLSNFLDESEEGDDEAITRRATKVVVDLGLTAHANARVHYDSRKKHVAKAVKTVAANEAAFKAAEKKATLQLQKVRSAASTVVVARKAHWFERFHWFISSENYLVLSGRDAQQNEMLVKKHFRRGDVYVHAELHGASSTIIKNRDPDCPVPPQTLEQAGAACVCRSRAWDSKIITSAWWVHFHQVSKSAPTGEYLPTGAFMVRGKKNFLPPQPLVFGFGFMFKLAEECIGGHLGERAVRGGGDGDSVFGGTEMEGMEGDDERVDDDIGDDGEGMGLDDDSSNDEAEDGAADGEDDGEDAEEDGQDKEEQTEQDPSAVKQQVSAIQQGVSMLTTGKLSAFDLFMEGGSASAGSTAPSHGFGSSYSQRGGSVVAPAPSMRASTTYGRDVATHFSRYGLVTSLEALDDAEDVPAAPVPSTSAATSRANASASPEGSSSSGPASAQEATPGGGGGGAGKDGGGRRHMSAHERSVMKKAQLQQQAGGSPGSESQNGNAVNKNPTSIPSSKPTRIPSARASSKIAAPNVILEGEEEGEQEDKEEDEWVDGVRVIKTPAPVAPAAAATPDKSKKGKAGAGGDAAASKGAQQKAKQQAAVVPAPVQGGGKKGSAGAMAVAAAAALAVLRQQGDGPAEAVPSSRGKKTKERKLKEKYADQDDEDREMAMSALCSVGTKKSKADRRGQRKAAREAGRVEALSGLAGGGGEEREEAIARATGKQWQKGTVPEEVESEEEQGCSSSSSSDDDNGPTRSATASQPQPPHQNGSSTDHPDSTQQDAIPSETSGPAASSQQQSQKSSSPVLGIDTAQHHSKPQDSTHSVPAPLPSGEWTEEQRLQNRQQKQQRQQQQAKDEISAILADENVVELGDEERERLTVLDSLTGMPRLEDLLLGAVPMCGPYSAMSNWKMKVKVTPGTVKKGKAAKQAMDLLSRGPDVAPRERDLLKLVPEMDLINAFVGACKLSMPGMQKLKQSEKKNKKAKAKASAGATAV